MSSSKIWQYGIPFMIFILGGSFGLREFTELRYRYKRTNEYILRKDLQEEGIKMKQPNEITLEKEYEKLKTVCKIM
ncbi:Cytochrome c oxidase assembly protein COX16-like protein, mitochondrial [Ooceraea biroi]|uniref:Cytochrome c oxidase assembly protein COX16 homolog, mitochondrial n=1 Tax=Ooceraea biroi TaxID=2015173 RepID=A0A026W3T9_OOCBI|nr:Cytochrome c oxidase assembly protein COX16-like protein, mitochondrial [Ooceraea biroi]